ncbi:MAG: LysM domain-containing protein [Rhodospirillales bacterium]
MAMSEGWKATMVAAAKNKSTADYDALVKTILDDYTKRFGKTPDLWRLPDAKLFKAIMLVESGGPAGSAWTTRVMQIGNPGDPALAVLRSKAQHSDLIMNADLQSRLADPKQFPIDDPSLNIQAGIAYAFVRAAKFTTSWVADLSNLIPYTVKSGDSLYRIALREHTSIEQLKTDNPTLAKVLHPGVVLKFHRGQYVTAISGWKAMDAQFFATQYNGGGDAEYAAKVEYVYALL